MKPIKEAEFEEVLDWLFYVFDDNVIYINRDGIFYDAYTDQIEFKDKKIMTDFVKKVNKIDEEFLMCFYKDGNFCEFTSSVNNKKTFNSSEELLDWLRSEANV